MTVTSRNTKKEILDAYNALVKDHRQLQKDHSTLQKQKGAATSAPAAAPAAAPRAAAPAAPRATAGATDVAGIIAGLTNLRSSLGSSTSGLQQKLTAEATRLAELRQQATDIVKNLNSLHSIEEVNEGTLGDLINTYNNHATTFNEELAEKRHALEDELSEKRETWKKEDAEHRRVIRERDAEIKKQRQREAAEFEYDLKLRRKLDEENYQLTQNTFEAELAALKDGKERTWSEREEALATREKEYAELKAKVDAFPEEKADAVKKAKEEGTGIGKRQARIKDDLIQKENEGKSRVYQLRIDSLEGTISKNNKLIEDLTQQLRKAQSQAQELAVKAIEGASNESSFLAIKEIALEQAKNTKNSK